MKTHHSQSSDHNHTRDVLYKQICVRMDRLSVNSNIKLELYEQHNFLSVGKLQHMLTWKDYDFIAWYNESMCICS